MKTIFKTEGTTVYYTLLYHGLLLMLTTHTVCVINASYLFLTLCSTITADELEYEIGMIYYYSTCRAIIRDAVERIPK